MIVVRRLFPKPINCTEYNPRAIARSAERIAAAQARMDADTDAYNRGLENIKKQCAKVHEVDHIVNTRK